MGIFKSKPGGTFLGNMLRGASNKFSGGILGNGAMLAKSQGLPSVPQINMDAVKGNVFDSLGSAVDKSPEVKKAIVTGIWTKYKFYILGAVAAIAATTIFLTRRKKTTYKKRY